MPRAVMLVHTNPMEDSRDDKFNAWYENVHLPEVLAVDGFVAATRYRVSAAQLVPGPTAHRYLAVYEIDSDDLAATTNALAKAAAGGMFISDAIELQPFPAVTLYEEAAPRQHAVTNRVPPDTAGRRTGTPPDHSQPVTQRASIRVGNWSSE